MTDFLPKDYTVPAGESRYMRWKTGVNRFRILAPPLMGWEDWKDKKPLRFRMGNKPEPIDPKKPVRHFWAVKVWNYATQRIEVLEITQPGIQKAISTFSADPDWGSPYSYDIKVTRTGSSFDDTEYTVSPCPAKEITDDVKELRDNTHVNLEVLFDGGDPFTPF